MTLYVFSDNLAQWKPTSQSNIFKERFASYAVDGLYTDLGPSCTHTRMQGTTDPWWRVDFDQVQPVSQVFILGRNKHVRRLNGSEITVGEYSYLNCYLKLSSLGA